MYSSGGWHALPGGTVPGYGEIFMVPEQEMDSLLLVVSEGFNLSTAVGRQWTPFSWAEFMAEDPVKTKIRSQKPKPTAASLFKWALALELDRERKAEPVGAGR